jgi:hypothetical protein
MPPSLETAGSPHGYEDRKTGLVVFGVLTILMGILCALLVPFMFLGQSMAPQGSVGSSAHTILPAAMMYFGIAVVLIWLGIGSTMARRWARALLLVLSWSWLVFGSIAMVCMIFMFPEIVARAHGGPQPAGQPTPPPELTSALMVVILLFMAVIYVVIPGIWVLFYRSRHVKATCETHDPVERWTDRTPLAVLALCVWLPFTSLSMLMVVVAYNSVVPFFGVFLTKSLGTAVYVLAAAIFAYSTWAIYKLRWSGWWLVMITLCLFASSTFITYSRHEVDELYVLMGYSPQELAQIHQFSFLNGKTLSWSTLYGLVPFVVYLLYLRRYFPGGKTNASATTSDAQ